MLVLPMRSQQFRPKPPQPQSHPLAIRLVGSAPDDLNVKLVKVQLHPNPPKLSVKNEKYLLKYNETNIIEVNEQNPDVNKTPEKSYVYSTNNQSKSTPNISVKCNSQPEPNRTESHNQTTIDNSLVNNPLLEAPKQSKNEQVDNINKILGV